MTQAETTDNLTIAPPKPRHPQKTALTVFCAVLAAVSVTLAAGVAVAANYQDRVLPRTYLAGTSLGGNDRDQAHLTITEIAEKFSAAPVTVQLDGDSSQISLTDLGVSVNTDDTESGLVADSNAWNWLTPGYWQRFLSKKQLKLTYELDDQKFKTTLADKLTASEIAVDAQVVVTDGQLAVTEGKIGRSIDMVEVRTDIEKYLITDGDGKIILAYVPTQPQISTAAATATKTAIEQAIRPVSLTGDDKSFTISANDLYGLIDYQKNNDKLGWSVSSSRLSGYIAQKISAKLDIKMIEKVIQTDTGAVQTEGKDGRAVSVAVLSKTILAAINARTDTAAAPIAIPIAAVPFTERRADPMFTTNLFDGLYLDVNLKNQHIYVIQDHIKAAEWLISSGKAGTPTPVGQYYIINKISLAQSKLFPGIWMQNWNALTTTKGSFGGYEGYGLHRVPCFNKQCTSREPLSHLGRPVSHGCIRIADEGADWVYANAPIDTPVYVHY